MKQREFARAVNLITQARLWHTRHLEKLNGGLRRYGFLPPAGRGQEGRDITAREAANTLIAYCTAAGDEMTGPKVEEYGKLKLVWPSGAEGRKRAKQYGATLSDCIEKALAEPNRKCRSIVFIKSYPCVTVTWQDEGEDEIELVYGDYASPSERDDKIGHHSTTLLVGLIHQLGIDLGETETEGAQL